jgi:hypothetical protein
MNIYIVYCAYYEDPSIEKIFLKEEDAIAYAEEQNKKYNAQRGWYVSYEIAE